MVRFIHLIIFKDKKNYRKQKAYIESTCTKCSIGSRLYHLVARKPLQNDANSHASLYETQIDLKQNGNKT